MLMHAIALYQGRVLPSLCCLYYACDRVISGQIPALFVLPLTMLMHAIALYQGRVLPSLCCLYRCLCMRSRYSRGDNHTMRRVDMDLIPFYLFQIHRVCQKFRRLIFEQCRSRSMCAIATVVLVTVNLNVKFPR